jgi:glycosyltransferase involved in cell wall biosynthesis
MSAERSPVVFAIPRSEVGGAQRSLVLLLRGLDRAAFPPFVILGEDGPLAAALRSLDVPFEVAPAPFRTLRGIRHFAKVSLREGARILHLYAARTLALAARGLGLAVVERVNLLRSEDAGGLVARPFLDRALLRLAHLAIVPAEAMLEQLALRGVPRSKLRLVRNGVFLDPPRASREEVRRELGILPDALALLDIARLHPMKGHLFLLEAFARVRRELPDARLLLAGEGSERAAIERSIADAGLSDAVRLLGDRASVTDLLGASDVIVQASIHSEVLSNAVLEALLAGKAVVATDIGGTREVVRTGETGILVPPRDAAALARAILELRDPARREPLGRAGRELVQSAHSVEAMARATESVYREALALVRSRRRSA